MRRSLSDKARRSALGSALRPPEERVRLQTRCSEDGLQGRGVSRWAAFIPSAGGHLRSGDLEAFLDWVVSLAESLVCRPKDLAFPIPQPRGVRHGRHRPRCVRPPDLGFWWWLLPWSSWGVLVSVKTGVPTTVLLRSFTFLFPSSHFIYLLVICSVIFILNK